MVAISEGPAPGGQSYVERPPVASLARLVSSVWVQQIAVDAQPYTQRDTPTGGVELTCALGAAPRVVGPSTGPLVETLAPGTTIVGLRFHPGASAPIVGRPASELQDVAVHAEELWGPTATAAAESVHDAASPEHALAALQASVVARTAEPPDPLVAEVVRRLRWGRGDVGALTEALHFSERQLRRRCLTAVGVAPKALHRILRFQRFVALSQRSLALGGTAGGDGLAGLATEAGYADQSHLTRECGRLAGVSPAEYLADTQEVCACGHDHSASYGPLLEARPGPAPAAAAL